MIDSCNNSKLRYVISLIPKISLLSVGVNELIILNEEGFKEKYFIKKCDLINNDIKLRPWKVGSGSYKLNLELSASKNQLCFYRSKVTYVTFKAYYSEVKYY